jgi:glycosyltransferase involved in cell wall biosynthesis
MPSGVPAMTLLMDFTCTRKESHSYDSLLRFQRALIKLGHENVIVCIPRGSVFTNKPSQSIHSLDVTLFKKQLSGEAKKMGWIEFLYSTFMIFRTIRKVVYKFNPAQLIWPNAEGSSLFAGLLISCFQKDRKFYFRFIGWTEFWTPSRNITLKLLIFLASFRKNIFLAFETEPLKTFLNGQGTVVPYPIEISKGSYERQIKTILLLGSARREKGFESMFVFAEQLLEALPEFKLVLQESVSPWNGYEMEFNKLQQIPNVILLPAYIDRSQVDDLIRKCTYTILPYDSNNYRIRGSAAMFESIENRKPVIALDGCSFSADIRDLNLGLVAKNIGDMVRCIKTLNNTRNVNFGFIEYANLSETQLRAWVNPAS